MAAAHRTPRLRSPRAGDTAEGKATFLRIFRDFKIERFKSEQNLKVHRSPVVPLPCSSPSPNTPAPGRLHNSCVRPALCRAAAFAPVGPPADGEQGKETSSHLVLGSPGSLSHAEVPRPPRLPSAPPLTPPAHTPGCRGSLCKAALRGRVGVFPSLSISKNIYPRSTSNCG